MSDTITEYLINEVAPKRLIQNDFSRRIFTSIFGLPADTTAIMKREAGSCQSQIDTFPAYRSEQLALQDRDEVLFISGSTTRESEQSRCTSAMSTRHNFVGREAIEYRLLQMGHSGSKVISAGLHGTDTYPLYQFDNGNVQDYPPSSEYWSQFIVVIPCYAIEGLGNTTVNWDQFYWNDGSRWNGKRPYAITDEKLNVIRSLVSRHKPVDWICRELVFINGDHVTSWNAGLFDSNPEGVLSTYRRDLIERWSLYG